MTLTLTLTLPVSVLAIASDDVDCYLMLCNAKGGNFPPFFL